MAGIQADQVAIYLKDMYKAEHEAYVQEPTVYDKVYKVMNEGSVVKGAGDKNTQILGAGDLTRHASENQDVLYKSPIQGWQFFVRYWTFSDGIALSKEAVEDTQKLGNLLKDLASTWGISERITKETFAARVFNAGGATTGDAIFNGSHTGNTAPYGNYFYDNKPLFNLTGNKRSTKGGGTYYNAIASNTLTPANFETLYNLMTKTNNRDERDRIVSMTPDTLLTEPGQDAFLADRIVGSGVGLPGGQLNDKNPYYKIVEPMYWHYLTDGAWYVGKKNSPDFQFHERQSSEIRFFRDELNLSYKASVNIRIGVFLKNFRTWHRSAGTYASTWAGIAF
jgi:hypothetical protein